MGKEERGGERQKEAEHDRDRERLLGWGRGWLNATELA
jgi:hypothetical protein